jgi:hypothetical protein
MTSSTPIATYELSTLVAIMVIPVTTMIMPIATD